MGTALQGVRYVSLRGAWICLNPSGLHQNRGRSRSVKAKGNATIRLNLGRTNSVRLAERRECRGLGILSRGLRPDRTSYKKKSGKDQSGQSQCPV